MQKCVSEFEEIYLGSKVCNPQVTSSVEPVGERQKQDVWVPNVMWTSSLLQGCKVHLTNMCKTTQGQGKNALKYIKKTSTTNAQMLIRQHAHMGIFFPAELSEFALQFYNWNPKVCQFIITSTHSHIHTVSCLGISMSGTAAKITAQKPFGELLGLFARRHVDTCLWRERKRAEGSSRGDTEETQTVKKMKIREERQKGKACKTEREKQSQRWKRQRALLWSKCAASFKHLLFLLQLNEHITSSAKLSVTHTHTCAQSFKSQQVALMLSPFLEKILQDDTRWLLQTHSCRESCSSIYGEQCCI